MTDLTAAEQRVADALSSHALPGKVIVLEELATTAQMAAEALGIEVGRIVKSLVFRGATTGKPYLLLVSGANRVHEKRVGRLIGEALERSDADYVKLHTGFSIGGVSPYGHPGPLATFIDHKLFEFATVWAAAGNPRSVFEVTAADLERTTAATRIEVT
jgi:prolyl-tRNA editing enzyme YbaK/EbsC (Cys-tRNA(Pro) deacylase)